MRIMNQQKETINGYVAFATNQLFMMIHHVLTLQHVMFVVIQVTFISLENVLTHYTNQPQLVKRTKQPKLWTVKSSMSKNQLTCTVENVELIVSYVLLKTIIMVSIIVLLAKCITTTISHTFDLLYITKMEYQLN